jgi:transcriptional regulator with XRE-family HTH domain
MNIVNETNQFLKKSGWTQKQLAAELGIHPVSLSKFMRDKRKIKSIGEKLYDFLISEKMRENENSLPS